MLWGSLKSVSTRRKPDRLAHESVSYMGREGKKSRALEALVQV